MMLGKVPRRPTDPKEALRRSFIPGAGFTYNGYPQMAGVVPITLPLGALELIMLNTSGFMDDAGVLPKSDAYTNYYAIAITTAFLFPYVTSLFDALRAAVEEFLYPMYSEVQQEGLCFFCVAAICMRSVTRILLPWIRRFQG